MSTTGRVFLAPPAYCALIDSKVSADLTSAPASIFNQSDCIPADFGHMGICCIWHVHILLLSVAKVLKHYADWTSIIKHDILLNTMNSIVKLKYFAVPFILITITLSAIPVKADQIFAYSDDLSSNFNLDMGQTRAKLTGGRAFTADDSVSSDITSDVVANPSKAIISARLDVSVNTPSNARIIYYISNNDGQRWMQINHGFTYSFDSVGNQLRWKAIITRESVLVESASIDSINLAYTVSDTLSVNPNNIYHNSGSINTSLLNTGGDINSYVCSALALIGL